MSTRTRFVSLLLLFGAIACGKKGPPLPPLVRIPTPPGAFTAQRRGSHVDIQLLVPGGNTDGSTPADINRVEVYALTAPVPVTPDDILRKGSRIGRVLVNPPPDPDTPAGEPAKPSGPVPEGGIDQAATARLSEDFTADETAEPSEVRSYVAVGFNNRGRRGAYSAVASVPLQPPPPPPGKPHVTFDEYSIWVLWDPPEDVDDSEATLGYHLYVPGEVPTRLTMQPLDDTWFEDKRIEWGAERCYIARTVETIGKLTLESEASPQTCITLVDTFAPSAPEGLTVVASEGAINLIWTPNDETDLDGYLLWRAIPAEGTLTAITPAPIKETTFKDTVPAGTRVAYALQAVDKAGNISPMSMRVEETAR